ncbi:VOC family protein [Companilactobacillus ginsenosidimutans]|uniref:3-demethylubiquinone-9 3-methyltransferase n=1 Tax=Companilactobacillus ginsenosidimutans TaxID=1007676 RepID=A0A0H4QGX3_9LACO|nr:glyoxalase/bleomycin resistance/extradiol dioxygenase family protein [Companilactobacillus ginsenosidimutans]AKP67187.1 3-demethylubiquinone-9 3-methyltransferase [Companilactobacillus ginsenosidimutans]
MRTQVYPYFAFKNAKEAIEYYERVFDATDVYRLSPKKEQAEMFHLPTNADLDSMTMHGGFTILGMKFECADAFNGDSTPVKGLQLMLDIDSEDKESHDAADALYKKLKQSGEVEITMPFAEQFWGGKMGAFTDKFGVQWMLHESPWSLSQDHKDE